MTTNRLIPALKFLLLLLLTILPAGVQADSCYANFHVKMDAVPTGAGVVYLNYIIDESDDISSLYVTLTTTPAEAIDEYITVKGINNYSCKLLAEPAEGWELVGFTTELKDEYAPEDFLGTTSPAEVVIWNVNPLYAFDGQSYEGAQEKGWDQDDDRQFYAIFRPVDAEGIPTVPDSNKSRQAYRLNGIKAKDANGIIIVNRKKVVRR